MRPGQCGNDPRTQLTPGRAAFEAWMRIIYPDQADGVPFEAIHPGQQEAWEAAAEAAVEAQDRTNARVWCRDHDSYCDVGTYHQPVPGTEAAR